MMDGYPAGICSIKVTADPLSEDEQAELPFAKQVDLAAKRLQDGSKVWQYGLKFFLAIAKKVGINDSIVNDVLKAICQIHYHKPAELNEMPGDDVEGVTEEMRERLTE